MIRRPPRSTLDRSSAASDVYKRQVLGSALMLAGENSRIVAKAVAEKLKELETKLPEGCLLYTSPSPRDRTRSRMPSSA